MKRCLFNLIAGASLLLCVGTAAMWARSHLAHDVWRPSPNSSWLIDSGGGRLMIGRTTPWTGQISRMPALARWYRVQPNPDGTISGLLFDGVRGYYVTFVTWCGALPFFWLLTWAIRRQGRMASGEWCLRCGYDLRATPDRCPECGTIPETAKATHPGAFPSTKLPTSR